MNHGSSTSMYYRDPDGNQIELKIENFPTIQEQRAWLRTKEFAENPTDTQFDPDRLAAQFPTGAPSPICPNAPSAIPTAERQTLTKCRAVQLRALRRRRISFRADLSCGSLRATISPSHIH